MDHSATSGFEIERHGKPPMRVYRKDCGHSDTRKTQKKERKSLLVSNVLDGYRRTSLYQLDVVPLGTGLAHTELEDMRSFGCFSCNHHGILTIWRGATGRLYFLRNVKWCCRAEMKRQLVALVYMGRPSQYPHPLPKLNA